MWRKLILIISFILTIWLAVAVFSNEKLLKPAIPINATVPGISSGMGDAKAEPRDGAAPEMPVSKADSGSRTGFVSGEDTARSQANGPQRNTLEPKGLSDRGGGELTTPIGPPTGSASSSPDQLTHRGADTKQQATKQNIAVETPQNWSGTPALAVAPPERATVKEGQPQDTVPITSGPLPQKLPKTTISAKSNVGPPPADQRRVRVSIPEEARRQ